MARHESVEVIREAVAAGIVDVRPPVVQHLSNFESSLIAVVIRNLEQKIAVTRIRSPWLGRQATWQLAQTRRYQVSKAPSITPITQDDPRLAWLVELARWPVPYGYFGVVKSLEQYLSTPVLEGPPSVWSASGRWGDPWYPGWTDSIMWHLRLTPIDRLPGLPWFVATGVNAIPDSLPDSSYSDLDSTPYLWYPAASPAAHNIHLPIPGGYVLRVFLLAGPRTAQDQLYAACRVTGTTQAETNIEAQNVARCSW